MSIHLISLYRVHLFFPIHRNPGILKRLFSFSFIISAIVTVEVCLNSIYLSGRNSSSVLFGTCIKDPSISEILHNVLRWDFSPVAVHHHS